MSLLDAFNLLILAMPFLVPIILLLQLYQMFRLRRATVRQHAPHLWARNVKIRTKKLPQKDKK